MEHCPFCDNAVSTRYDPKVWLWITHCWQCAYHSVARG